MNKVYNKDVDKYLYLETLDNGLNILLIPDKKEKMYYVDILVKYGAKDLEYIDELGNRIIDPQGIAHYLEHQKFNVKGSIPFDYFNKTGTSSNACTSYGYTRYYINGMKSFKRNLNYFLNMIFTPYFTKKSVSKELGIITEEVNMYDDWYGKIDDCMRNNIYFNNNAKYKVAGTVDSIKNINKDNLLHAYNNFYKPSNMLLVITGNINVDNTLNIIKSNKVLNNIKYSKVAERIINKESNLTRKEYTLLNYDIENTKLDYAFKLKYDMNYKFEYYAYLDIILYIMFGKTSLFSEKVNLDMLATDYYYSMEMDDDFILLEFVAESEKADMFKDLVDETLNNFEIKIDDLNRYKKVIKSDLIRKSDNVSYIGSEYIRNYRLYDDLLLNKNDLIQNIKLEDLISLKNSIDFSNNTFVLCIPKKEM